MSIYKLVLMAAAHTTVYRSLSMCTCLSLVANSSPPSHAIAWAAHEQDIYYIVIIIVYHGATCANAFQLVIHLTWAIPCFYCITLHFISYSILFFSFSLMTITRQFFTVSIQFRLIDVTVSLACTTYDTYCIDTHQFDSLSLFSPSKNSFRSILSAHTLSQLTISHGPSFISQEQPLF